MRPINNWLLRFVSCVFVCMGVLFGIKSASAVQLPTLGDCFELGDIFGPTETKDYDCDGKTSNLNYSVYINSDLSLSGYGICSTDGAPTYSIGDIGNPASTTGVNCWCTLDGYSITGAGQGASGNLANAVLINTDYKNSSDCNAQCGCECAGRVADASFAIQLYGLKEVNNQFCTCPPLADFYTNFDCRNMRIDVASYSGSNWTISFRDGTSVTGTSLCSATVTSNGNPGPGVPSETQTGDYCWCRATSFYNGTTTTNATDSSWYFATPISNCNTNDCAHVCSGAIAEPIGNGNCTFLENLSFCPEEVTCITLNTLFSKPEKPNVVASNANGSDFTLTYNEGSVYGTGMCSATGASNIGDTNPSPSTTSGNYCWCNLTGYDTGSGTVSGSLSNWYFASSIDPCTDSDCAMECTKGKIFDLFLPTMFADDFCEDEGGGSGGGNYNYTFSLTTTSGVSSFDFSLSASGTFYVDCGNGGTLTSSASPTDVSGNTITRSGTTEETYTCTWGSTGTQTIQFGGTATGYSTATNTAAISFYAYSDTNAAKVASISGNLSTIFPYNSGNQPTGAQPRFYETFKGTSITSIPVTLFQNYTTASTHMFYSTFIGCTSLTSAGIPSNLFFPNATSVSGAVEMFSNTFQGCTSLTSIPSGLFAKVTSSEQSLFSGTFLGCTSLTSAGIPSNLFFPNASSVSGASNLFDSTFNGCTGLTSIPTGLFAKVTSPAIWMFSNTFRNCTSLTSAGIPSNLFFPNASSVSGTERLFHSTFYGCTSLTSIPTGLFAKVTSSAQGMFGGTFSGCTGLTSAGIPSNLFFPNASSVSGASQMFIATFYGCTGLTSIPSDLFAKVTSPVSNMFENTFKDCTNLGCETTGCSTGTGYIPPSTFSGLIANDSTKTTNMWDKAFNGTKLVTTCPTGTVQYTTGYEGNTNGTTWNGKVSCVQQTPPTVTYSCGDGTGNPPTDSNSPYTPGSTVTVLANTCTHPSGYIFTGWSCNGQIFEPGDTFTIYNDTTCTAQYHKFTLTTTSGVSSFNFSLSAIGTFTVDCGNGGTLSGNGVSGNTITRVSAEETIYTCTWGSTGTQTIGFNGTATGYNPTSGATPVISFYAGANPNAKAANAAKIASISGDLSAIFPSIPSNTNLRFYETFRGASITSIPSTLFQNYTTSFPTMFHSTFMDCTSLTSIPSDLFFPNATSVSGAYNMFNSTFNGCTSLTSIPTGLFAKVTSPAEHMFSHTFFLCTSLTTIPSNLFFSNATSVSGEGNMFYGTFRNCTSLTSIPTGLFAKITSGAQNLFTNTFQECTSLTSNGIPSNLFFPNVSSVSGVEYMFTGTFYGCTSLTSIPTGLFAKVTSSAKNLFNNTFMNCTSLTSIPSDLFFPNATSVLGAESMFAGTFSYCTSLTSIPSGLFAKVTSSAPSMFTNTFNGCTSLTSAGIPQNLFFPNATSVSGAEGMFNTTFYYCTSLTSLPANLFAKVTSPATDMFKRTFDGCTNLGCVTAGCSTGTGYIPPSTFSGLITNDSTKTTNMWSNAFTNTKLVTTCPTGTVQYPTGYEGNTNGTTWNGKVSCKEVKTLTYSCGTGTGTQPTDSNSPYIYGTSVTTLANTCTPPSGQVFREWYCSSSNASTYVAVGGSFLIGSDTTCTAQYWTPKFSLTTTSDVSSFSFTLSASGEFHVDCGNGGTLSIDATPPISTDVSGKTITRSDTNQKTYKCTWGSSGTHTIQFGGTAIGYNSNISTPAISFSTTIASISGNLSAMFPYKSGLLPNGAQPRFYYTFAGTSITSIPATLFQNYTTASTYMFRQTFLNCTSLTSIPENLFFPYATSVSGAEGMFYSTFKGCTSLTAIPVNLFFPSATSVSGATYMFRETFQNCTSLTSIPENLFAKITSPATNMFQDTFRSCSNLGCETTGCSTGTRYIPPSTFAGLIANDSTKTTNMWNGAFTGTKLVTTCPTGTTKYITGYESRWTGKVSCYNCAAGYYANNNGCTQCPSEYPSSPNNNPGDITSCYRSCTTNDVANSTAVTGDYHSGGSNDCTATACAAGSYLDNGVCTGCPTAYPNSAAGSTSINDCYVTLSAGYEVASAGAGKTACAGGKYNTSTANIYYGGNVSGRATTNTCSNITAGYYCAGGAKTATPSSTSDSVTGAACGNCASANGANGRMQYSDAGAASCSECPAVTGTLASRVVSYSGWWGQGNPLHDRITGCTAYFNDNDSDATFTTMCYYNNTVDGYGGSSSCYIYKSRVTACAAGKYLTLESTSEYSSSAGYAHCYGVDCMNGKVCTDTTAGYYSADGALTQTECGDGSYSSAGAASCTACTTTSGWATHTTSTTATSYTACYQTHTPSGCASGNTKRTASSISGTTITYGTETVENALSASGGHKVSGATCPECGDGSYYAGGTATSCTACTTTSGWATHTTSTTATAYSACYQTRTPNGCASGNTKRTASSISGTTITYGTETVENALSASGGHKVSGTTCPECGDGYYYAGGTATSCTACPTRTDTTWTVHTTSTTASAYSACYETKPASSVSSYCHSGQLSRTADSANSWGTATSTLTAKQGSIITGTGNNTTCSQCTGATYMASADGHSNTACTSCPTPNDHKRTTFPSNYYGGNAVESSNAVSKTGSTSITQCEVQNWVTGTRGRLNEHATYNTTTEKYDVYVWHKWTGANAGYYLFDKDSCGSYAYYQDAAACESGSYCPGKATTECNSSNQSTVWTTTFGKESCSSLTGVSPTGGTYSSDGNRDAKTSCLYTAPSDKTISGCKTVTSQAVRYTSNNTWPASTYGVTANKGHIVLNNNQSNASCPECTSGTFMATDGNTATSCTACPTGYSGSDGGFDAQTDCYKSCSNTTVAHATPTSVTPNSAKVYYTGSAYPSCTYNPSCDTGYTATNGANPVCNANTNTITLNGNGATGGKIKNNAMTSGAVTFTCTTDSSMSLPTWSATDSASTTSIINDNNRFIGWSESSSCTTSSCVVNPTTCPTGNKTYYAVWSACTACNAGANCTCQIKVIDNTCTYITSTDNYCYYVSSGANTNAPVCALYTPTITVTAGRGVSTVAATGWTNSGTATMTKSCDCGSIINLGTTVTPTFKSCYATVGYSKTSGSGSLSVQTYTCGPSDATITAAATGISSASVSISPNHTSQIYDYQPVTLTATLSTNCDSGITKYYKFGTSDSESGTYNYDSNWETSNTKTIAKNAYLGQKYYKVQSFLSDGTLTSATQTSTAVDVILVQKNLDFFASPNCLLHTYATCGTISGTSSCRQLLYYRYNSATLYTSETGTTTGTVPTAHQDHATFNGWYTAASGGSQVYSATGVLQGSVSGYTNSTPAWIKPEGAKLHAQYTCDTGYVNNNGCCTARRNTITLNANGAKTGQIIQISISDSEQTAMFKCDTDSSMSLPTWSATDSASTTSLVKTNSTFLGWAESSSCTTSSCVVNPTTCPTGDKTYYAVWSDCTACSTATTTTNTANCGLDVEDNVCTYTTSCKGGYGTLSGAGTNAPSCTQCSAGTASANGDNTCSVCGANKWSAAGAASCSDCQSGYTNSGNSATNHANNSSCKITVTAGHYIDTVGQNSSNWKTCAAGTAKAQHTVSYGSTSPNSACDACTGATYSDTAGAGSCTTCPTATQYASIVSGYGYWTENGVHNTVYGCRATFNEQDSTGDYALSCGYSTQGDYGTGGGDRACMAGHVTSCAGGRYAPYENPDSNVVWTSSIANMYGSVCVDAGTGYYSANGDTGRTECPENYRSGAAASSQSGCSTTCNAGYAVLSANGACTTIQNSTYKGKWIGANTVTYGNTSTINNCPTNYQSANGTTAQSNCETTCTAGTQVASANAACSTPTGTNWYTAQHNVKYGSTSGTNVKTCATGYKTANTSTATDHDNQNDCKIGCDAGYYIPTAGQGCQSCPSGKYCSAISNIAETATSAATGNITAGYYCAGGAKTATPSGTSDSVTGASCGNCASSDGANGRKQYSNAGAASCSECPAVTGTLASRVISYNGYWTNNIHGSINGCYAAFSDDDTSATFKTICYYNSTDGAYGGTNSTCQVYLSYVTACATGKYRTIETTTEYLNRSDNSAVCYGVDCMKGKVCTNTTAGYYSTEGAMTQTACANGSYSTAGSSSCTPCAGGKKNTGTGNSSCNDNCPTIANLATWETPSWNSNNNTVSNLCTVKTCQSCTNGTGAQNCTYNINNNACNYTATCKTGYSTNGGTNNGTSAVCTGSNCVCNAKTIGLTWYEADGTTQANVSAESETCTYGEPINLPDNPTKTGFTFTGWSVKK